MTSDSVMYRYSYIGNVASFTALHAYYTLFTEIIVTKLNNLAHLQNNN